MALKPKSMDEPLKKKFYDVDGNEVEGAVSSEEAAQQVAEVEAKAEEAKKAHDVELEKIKEENREAILKGKTEPGKILVDEEALKDLIRRVERVEGASDVGRLANIDAKNRKQPAGVIRLGVWQGNVITGWKLKANSVEKVNGVWRELQTMELKFEKEPAVEVPYIQFIQDTVKVDATIISRTKDEDGEHEILKVKRNDNGQEVLIDATFANL